jgi:hypothetical protein
MPLKEVLDDALKEDDLNIIKGYLENGEKVAPVLSVLARAISVDYETYMRYAEIPSGAEQEEYLSDFVDLTFDHIDEMLPLAGRWIRDMKGSTQVAEKLMSYLVDPDPAVRKATAYALGQMEYQRAIPGLLALLEDPHLWVRDATVLSLALFADAAVNPIGSAMERGTPSFRILALDVLARIKGDRARALIEKHLDDPNENVRRAAKQALSRFY